MTMTASLNTIHEAIGALKTEVVSLRREMQSDAEAAVEASKEASAGRSALYQRVDDVAQRTASLESGMTGVQRDLIEVKAVTNEVTAWKQRGMGALAVTGIASSALTALAVGYWKEIKHMLLGA